MLQKPILKTSFLILNEYDRACVRLYLLSPLLAVVRNLTKNKTIVEMQVRIRFIFTLFSLHY